MFKNSYFFCGVRRLVACGLAFVAGMQVACAAHDVGPTTTQTHAIVAFDPNGGTGGTTQVAIDYGTDPDPKGYDLTKYAPDGVFSVPTRENCDFLGYYENGDQYIDASGAFVQNYKLQKGHNDVVLTAKWRCRFELGVTVNGEDVSLGCGRGWVTDPAGDGYFDLTGGVDYVVSGTNLNGEVMIAVTHDAALTISNLNLKCTTPNECCIWATNNVAVKILLAGDNMLDASTVPAEAICIENGSKLTIDKAPGLSDDQAKLTAIGGSRGAAIGVGVRSTLPGSTLYIDGGTIVARGGAGAAGIGSSYTDAYREGSLQSDIHIRGGQVTAYGGAGTIESSTYRAYGSGAGIGSAAFNYFARTDVHISGGYVEAYGGQDAAGIGSGCDSRGGTVEVSGGTVVATHGERCNDTQYDPMGEFLAQKATDMKNGWYGDYGKNTGDLMLTGGSVMMTHVVAAVKEEAPETRPDPIDGASNRVWCVTVPGIAADGAVTFAGLPEGYGTTDIVAIEGKAYLWLPDGQYQFVADGYVYETKVDGAHTTAVKKGPALPPLAYIDADGTEKTCIVYTVVTTLTATFEDGVWYAVTETVSRGSITVNGAAHLILCDGASLTTDAPLKYAGIRVTKGNKLTIYGQSDGSGQLTANGNYGGAGIGANNGDEYGSGTVIINGGTVTATGATSGAGIGGGNGNSNGTVIINGGTVTATGGSNGSEGGAAGIGGGLYYGSGGIVTINGGAVTATGGPGAAGIGGGDSHRYPGKYDDQGDGPTFTINGGTVTATGGDGAPAIGPGSEGKAPGSVTFGDGCAWLVKAGTSASSATVVTAGDYAERHAQEYVHIEATEERQGVKIISIAIQTEGGQSQFEAKFASTKGASYALLRSEDLLKPIDQWKVIVTEQAPGENFMLADPNPPAEKAFYMVVTGAVGE